MLIYSHCKNYKELKKLIYIVDAVKIIINIVNCNDPNPNKKVFMSIKPIYEISVIELANKTKNSFYQSI